MQRLDKILSDAGVASRKDLKILFKRSCVTVNGVVVKDNDLKVEPSEVKIEVNGEPVSLRRRIVGILNKPAGYVTSTEDPRDPTVMELLPLEYEHMGLVPAGRLDKDTEGLLIMTNDGDLVHRLISPKYEVRKVYLVKHEGLVTEADITAFACGLTLRDGTVCKPSVLEVLDPETCLVTVTEGKYHQVRRMMASRGLHVTYLKRIEENGLSLGNLPSGSFCEIDEL